MKIQAIIAAAGTGKRLGMDDPKPFILLKDKPLVFYALKVFEAADVIDSIIVAAAPEALDRMNDVIHQENLTKVKKVIAGGKLRSESVKNALSVLDDDTDYVAIHDGARPLITVDFIKKMVEAVEDVDALIAAVPVKPTIKQVDFQTLEVVKTLNRSCLWNVQTPQIFKKDILMQAYEAGDLTVTDDAALIEQLGKPVKVFPGLEQNIKLTTPQDFFIIEKMLGKGH